MAKTIIVSAGPMRSGSTWQYNVLRGLAAAARGNAYGAWVKDYDPTRAETMHIVKAHDPAQLSGFAYDAVVTGYRDLRDVFASIRRMAWQSYERPTQITAFLNRYTSFVTAWETKAIHVMRYEDMVLDPSAEARRMAAALGLMLAPSAVDDVCQRVADMKPSLAAPTGDRMDYDRETLLHPGHISSVATPLDDKTRQFIDARYGRWLRDHGYQTAAKPWWSFLRP